MSSKLLLPKGIYRDLVLARDKTIIDLGWRSNMVVDRCRLLIAGFMKGDNSSGIQFLKIGRGEKSWDEHPPAPPSRADSQLTDPDPFQIEIEPGLIEYLDPSGDAAEEGPTNRIQVRVTIEPGIPPIESEGASYPLREFGLFGAFGEDEYMIDYVRHPVINKRADDTLIRTIRLIF